MQTLRSGPAVLVLFMVIVPSVAAAAGTPESPLLGSKLELFVHDVDASVAFYEVLGFAIAHRKDGGYTTLANGATVIALSPTPWWLATHWLGALRYPPMGTEIVLYFADLEGMRRELGLAGFRPGEISLQPWGDRDFRVRDPDGYYVRVSQGTTIPPNKNAVAE